MVCNWLQLNSPLLPERTSSPWYPQSNGKAKNAVKTVKRLFIKCQEAGQSEFLALLDWCSTLIEGVSTSPAWVSTSCRWRDRYCNHNTQKKAMLVPLITKRKDNTTTTITKPNNSSQIEPGNEVRLQLPGSAVVCNTLVILRSYQVKVDGGVFTCNCCQIIPMNSHSLQEIPDIELLITTRYLWGISRPTSWTQTLPTVITWQSCILKSVPI